MPLRALQSSSLSVQMTKKKYKASFANEVEHLLPKLGFPDAALAKYTVRRARSEE